MGQHFLVNASAARRLIASFSPREGETVLEIGPGRGALTERLLAAGSHVIAVELDRALYEDLSRRFAEQSGLNLIHADILGCDLERIAAQKPYRVLANIPYSITGELLPRLLLATGTIRGMMLMVQKEVADRIVAPPGGRTYGSIAALSQYFTDPRIVMRLRPGSFDPPPEVHSAVVEMPPRLDRELTESLEIDHARFVRALFGRRRQTLRNNLRAMGLLDPVTRRLPSVPTLDLGRRPETLDRKELVELFLGTRD